MQPTNNNGSIIIRFSKFGYKYSLTNLGKFDDSWSMATARNICAAIETDIDIGRFEAKSNDELFKAYHPLANLARQIVDSRFDVDAVTLLQKYLDAKPYQDKAMKPCLQLLVKFGKPINTKEMALKFWQWLNDGTRKPSSCNRYLASLKPVCPMFQGIKPLKVKQSQDEKPFTKSEIKSICEVFDRDYPHYSSFIKFLFSTGCRTSEATALTWDKVDFEAKTITISESVGMANDGSKVRKETKTGVTRVIPMSDKVYGLLKNNYNKISHIEDLNSLVFPSPNGQFIDLSNFRARVWKPALEEAKVPYRTLYNTRHTFVSHFLNETPDFVKCASITHGTKSGVQTLNKHYAHLVSDISMPDMF